MVMLCTHTDRRTQKAQRCTRVCTYTKSQPQAQLRCVWLRARTKSRMLRCNTCSHEKIHDHSNEWAWTSKWIIRSFSAYNLRRMLAYCFETGTQESKFHLRSRVETLQRNTQNWGSLPRMRLLQQLKAHNMKGGIKKKKKNYHFLQRCRLPQPMLWILCWNEVHNTSRLPGHKFQPVKFVNLENFRRREGVVTDVCMMTCSENSEQHCSNCTCAIAL